MSALSQQLRVTIRLQLRNRMGLIYGYLFPTIFLVAFWVLYRYEQVPLALHMGELLTVTALGGACFGLPTAMVSERERGVWRRYRLTPVPTATLVAGVVVARYLLLLSAAILQIALAMAIGMPRPNHPLDLWIAFTLVCFAFLGLGLVIAMLADNVPAVQALGQCIFLPMLIIGGVAVRLERLPEWAQHLSAFFPGRYAVEAIQRSVTGDGLGDARFPLVALLLIGVAGSLAGAKLFRWDAQTRFGARGERGWALLALAGWVSVGIAAEATGYVTARRASPSDGTAAPPVLLAPAPRPDSARAATPPVAAAPDDTATAAPPAAAPSTAAPVATAPPAPPARPDSAAAVAAAPPEAPPVPGTWQAVTMEEMNQLDFERLPPDGGVVTPIAPAGEDPHPYIARQIECVHEKLADWEPAQVADPVQRVRNYLYVASVPDVAQMEGIESLVPLVVFDRLKRAVPREQLMRALFWIATRPSEGDARAADLVDLVCLEAGGPGSLQELRVRTSIYAAKLLGRLLGRIPEG